MEIQQTWTEFKSTVSSKVLYVQYKTFNGYYEIWAQEGSTVYTCDIEIETTATGDQKEFEDDYKTDANKALAPVDSEGRLFLRAESKPTEMTTYFTSKGDSSTEIGAGTHLVFDFNNTDNDVASPPTGTKQKEVHCTFVDTVRLKEGAVYWENMPFGSSISLCLAVPDDAYYYKNDGTLAQNTTGDPLHIARFVNEAPMMGDCPMGDEMNTEAASNDIIAGTIFGLLVTVPSTVSSTDNVHGVVILELYRKRTVVLE